MPPLMKKLQALWRAVVQAESCDASFRRGLIIRSTRATGCAAAAPRKTPAH